MTAFATSAIKRLTQAHNQSNIDQKSPGPTARRLSRSEDFR